MSEIEIVIIGAGAAGLAAGAALAKAGKSFLILEARDRIGGRVHTVRDANWPLPLEFGAEFIHGRPSESWELVRRTGLRVYDVTGQHWQSRDGAPVKESRGWSEMDAVMQRLDRVAKEDKTFDQFLQEDCADLPPAGKAMARAFVEGLDAADAKLVSAQSIQNSESDGDKFDADKAFRIFDGYDRLIEALAGALPEKNIQLNVAVKSIRWSRGSVQIESQDGRQFAAARAIITLPIGVLLALPDQPGAVRFDPPLPQKMRAAIELMRMGPVVKVLLRFHRAFWEEGDWQDLGFLHSPGDAIPTWWTMLPCRVPILTGWAGGPAAAALSNRPASEVLDAALHTLAPRLGVSESVIRSELAAWHVSDWQADPYARGAYAFAMVGGAESAKQMCEPVEETLYFAGEATHPGYAGTVHAAIASGRRAAEQTLGGP